MCEVQSVMPKAKEQTRLASAEEETNPSASQSLESSRNCTDDEEEMQTTAEHSDDSPPMRTSSQIVKQSEIAVIRGRVDSRSSSVRQLRSQSLELQSQCATVDPREVQHALEDARKKARNYGEDLLEDMLALDKLSGLAGEDRALRKVILAQIEEMLDVLDSTKSLLAKVSREMESKLVQIQADSAARQQSSVKAAKKALPATQAPHQPLPDVAFPTKELWQQLKVELPFQTERAGGRYILWTPAENLDTQSLKLELSDDGRCLLVKGLCMPTAEQALQMRQKVQSVLAGAERPACPRFLAGMYLKLGEGRFGRFSEVFRIPSDADVQGVEASIQQGMLQVVLPQKQRQVPYASRPHMPYASPLSHNRAMHPFHGGVFGGW